MTAVEHSEFRLDFNISYHEHFYNCFHIHISFGVVSCADSYVCCVSTFFRLEFFMFPYHKIGYATNARSKCTSCKENISNGQLRIGVKIKVIRKLSFLIQKLLL